MPGCCIAPPEGASTNRRCTEKLFRQARSAGRVLDGIALLRAASRILPSFADATELTEPPRPVRLASGPAATALVCFPAVVALSGPHQYARFAGALRGTRDVVAFPQPGFQPGTLLPAHLEAVVEAQTEAVRAYVDGAPVALLGYSSGGWVAHAVAERLQELGESLRAVVLLDTYVQDETGPETATAFTEGLFDRHGPAATADAASLTAMGAYFRVFEKWSPGEIAAPTLFLRATEALSEAGTPSRALTLGGRADRVLDVPGDHFTMLEEHAEQAARAVHTWLVEAAEEPRPGPATPKRSDRHV